jgi:LmbE family N-acetylglucosaminyl deacetylase
MMNSKQILLVFALVFANTVFAQGPKVLVVTAHPDDETGFSVTMFKITHELKGIVDMAVMTDGGGGFADSQLGAMYYGLNLTDSVTARNHLPLIRKQEIINAGRIMGVRNMFYMEQPDDWYSTDPMPYISGKNWDIAYVEKRMDRILAEGDYDFILTMLPHEGQHGHHKTAVLMGLRAVKRFKGVKKPIIIAGTPATVNSKPNQFSMLPGFPETKLKSGAPTFILNRAFKFKENDKVSYKIVADWVIAEYKSQGAIQESGIHKTDLEIYHYFDINDASGIRQVQQLFNNLANSGFKAPPIP